ncbi:hypothetical protein [Oryzomonas sagensis]|uniref:hypothetical protein n=1 Tax=Oryzomonas sagensis TaxID=2603857 RepID=UPI001787439A|nr:hypothetical protein [Oryzomonas sagensis]
MSKTPEELFEEWFYQETGAWRHTANVDPDHAKIAFLAGLATAHEWQPLPPAPKG